MKNEHGEIEQVSTIKFVILVFFLTLVVFYSFAPVIWVVGGILHLLGFHELGEYKTSLIKNIVMNAGGIGAAVGVHYFREGGIPKLLKQFKVNRQVIAWAGLGIVGLWGVFLLIGIVLFLVTGEFPEENNFPFSFELISNSPMNLVLMFSHVVILGPIFEECVFRAVAYSMLRKNLSASTSIVISSIFFTLIGVSDSLIDALVHFVGGILLAFVYERTGSILTPIFLHMTLNIIALGAWAFGVVA